MDVLETLKIALDRLPTCLGEPPRFLLAVSGGADSMVLLDTFSRLLPPSQLRVAHFNHGVRGVEADTDQEHVRQEAQQREIAFLTTRIPPGRTDEASLRDARNHFLEAMRAQTGCAYTVKAHHVDDQLETFLMRLVRGTGLDGLACMGVVSGHTFRPFLGVARQQLLDYARARGVAFREDSTNGSPKYLRNRLRHTLVPQMKALCAEYGGEDAFFTRFSALTQEAGQVRQELERQTRVYLSHTAVSTAFWTRIDLRRLRLLPPLWRGRVLRAAIQGLGGPIPDRSTLEALTEAFKRGTSRVCFPGFSYEQSCGQGYLQSKHQQGLTNAPRPIVQRGKEYRICAMGIALQVRTEIPGELRFFRPGDRMGGTKLKKWFLENKVPRPERNLVPLWAVPESSEVMWVFPQSHPHVRVKSCAFPFLQAQ